jgi:hypothetical protein
MEKRLTLLFPGSFSPYTDGHHSILMKYLGEAEAQGYEVDDIRIIVSKKDRDSIPSKINLWFMESLYSQDTRVHPSLAEKKSPIGDCYAIAKVEYEDGKINNRFVAMVASTKDDDSRLEEFKTNLDKQGKGSQVVTLKVNNEPTVYNGRKDGYEGKPISASVARQDIRNNDLESFRTNYQRILEYSNKKNMPKYVDKLFAILKRKVSEHPDQETSDKLEDM